MIYLILILYHNEIQHSEPFYSLLEAEDTAIALANEWYNTDGIATYGKYQLETIEEVRDYYRSDAYLDSGDSIHIVIEEIAI